MSSEKERLSEAGRKVIERAANERRRFRRVSVNITGRLYIPSTEEEAMCTVLDISPGDVAVHCDLKEEPNGRAVIYLDNLGRFEGPVVRTANGRFVMTFSCSLQKREKLADQLTLEVNRHLLADTELRRYDRVEAVSGSYTHFTRSTGEQVRCEVLDLSLTGVSVRTEHRPPVGEHILIGHRAGRIARHHAQGMGIEFLGLSFAPGSETDTPQSPDLSPPTRPISTKPAHVASAPAGSAKAARR
jgi:c-di-GMP-binding flagellar brake protein YcgR